jgi:signal transduction histidine kinase
MSGKGGKAPSPLSPQREVEVAHLVAELELLRGLAHLLPEGIVIHDPSGDVVFLNESMQKLCGGAMPATFAELGEVLLNGTVAQTLQAALLRAQNAGGVFLEDIRSADTYLTASSREMRRGGEGLRLWSFADRSAELQRGEARHLDAVNVFATGIAHNFNNLLCGISGAIDMLEGIAGEDTRAKRCVGLTRRCVDEGVALTRKMIATGPQAVSGDMSAVLEDVVKSVVEVHEVLQSGRVAFELALPPDLPPVGMPWDSLARVVQNLVLNSVEAIEAVGKVTISATAAPTTDALTLKIEDTGSGMDETTLRRVFEPFFSTKSLDQAHGIASDGSGLGLWNVYRAVKTAGGSVSMKSQVGRGTTVEVTLPIVREG